MSGNVSLLTFSSSCNIGLKWIKLWNFMLLKRLIFQDKVWAWYYGIPCLKFDKKVSSAIQCSLNTKLRVLHCDVWVYNSFQIFRTELCGCYVNLKFFKYILNSDSHTFFFICFLLHWCMPFQPFVLEKKED